MSLGMRTAARPGVSASRSARNVRVNAAAGRPNFFPGNEPPKWLDGSMVGDYGFDPLSLGEDPEDLAWYVQAELVHARFAMLGAAGILGPDVLTSIGLLDIPPWYEAGATKFGFTDAVTLTVVQTFLMGFVESKRYYDIINPGSQGVEGSFIGFEDGFKGTDAVGYPGGIFDPLGYADDPDTLKMMKVKEIANGRLAMLAMLGFYAQAGATKTTPVANWLAHLADPFNVTIAKFDPLKITSIPPGGSA